MEISSDGDLEFCDNCGETLSNHVSLKCPFDATSYRYGGSLIGRNVLQELMEAEDRKMLKILLELDR